MRERVAWAAHKTGDSRMNHKLCITGFCYIEPAYMAALKVLQGLALLKRATSNWDTPTQVTLTIQVEDQKSKLIGLGADHYDLEQYVQLLSQAGLYYYFFDKDHALKLFIVRRRLLRSLRVRSKESMSSQDRLRTAFASEGR